MDTAGIKPIAYGILAALAFFMVSGIITALLPSPFFTRMASTVFLDYFFLVMTSLLLGTFVALHAYHKRKAHKSREKACAVTAAGGSVGGFLGFSCTICNKLLVFFLGVSGVLVMVEPYRPLLGFLGMGLLLLAVIRKAKALRRAHYQVKAAQTSPDA